MDDPKKPKPQQDTNKARISRNVDKMAAQGASDAEIEEYIQSEGVRPVQAAGDSQLRKDIGDLRNQVESTGVAPRAPSTAPNAAEGVLDAGLNSATFGLHQKGLGLTDALIDIATHGTGAHPIETYKQSTQATRERIAAAGKKHPLAKTASEAVGFFGPLALEAPIRAVAGLPEVAQAVRGVGARAVVKRIGRNTALGGATGAAMTGMASDGPLDKRPAQMVAGGVLGALLGGGATAVAEGVTGANALRKKLFQSATAKGSKAARQQIVQGLAGTGRSPESLLEASQRAQETGTPAVAAHLGGTGLDDLSYLGASSATPSGAVFKETLRNAQRGEHGMLQRGVTVMSGLDDVPGNRTPAFLSALEEGRSAAGKADYPMAYREPPVDDPEILAAIRRDPDLRASLGEGMKIIGREDELERLRSGAVPPIRPDPLAGGGDAPRLSDIGRQLIEMGVPEERVIAQGHILAPEDAPALPIKALDYMKRGVEPVIQSKTAKEGLQAHDADIIRAKVQTILEQIDPSRPSYQAARQRQASFFGREEGAVAGKSALNKTGAEIQQQLGDFARPGQADAYRTTATSALRDAIEGKRFDADVGTSLFDSPESRGQLGALFGAEARDRLQPYLDQGGVLNRVLKAATGGSQTEPRQAIRAAAKAASGVNIPTALAGVRKSVIGGHEQRVMRAMSETLAQELNIPANSPELGSLVERLYQSIDQGRFPPNMFWKGPTEAASLGLSGRLAAALAGEL